MRCPYCGEQNPDTARRCSRCGRRLDKVRVKKRERQLLLMGIILILVILAAGIGAMFGISKFLKDGQNNTPQKVTIKATPTPEEESVTSSSSSVSVSSTSEPSVTPEAEEDKLTASIVDASRQSQIDLLGYSQVTVASADATSTISQAGIDNTPHVLYDGSKDSSWQEGVDGSGIGESVTYHLDQVCKVRFLVLRLGNWYGSDDNYTMNNRPKTMTFEFGDQSVQVTFPDEKKEFCVELSKDVETSEIKMTIDEVYKGTDYDDTCINEVDVYGVPTGETAAGAGTDTNGAAGTGTQSAGASGSGTDGSASGTAGTAGGAAGEADGNGSTEAGNTAGGTGTYGAGANGTDIYGGAGSYGGTDSSTYGSGNAGGSYSSGNADGTYNSGYGAGAGYGDGTYGGTANYGQTNNYNGY
ncbi:NADase-type glycan-binding domain-containing protein [Bilifractor sp. HCP3S3_D3]|uniref:NADase-type glycan-binding domain-containing protein n=1 Tax=Bilifractor sp. HCP3S3_D3 TaxID=3438907 RepID=UPI003F8C1893